MVFEEKLREAIRVYLDKEYEDTEIKEVLEKSSKEDNSDDLADNLQEAKDEY